MIIIINKQNKLQQKTYVELELSRIIRFFRLCSIELCRSKILSYGIFSEVLNDQCLALVKLKLTVKINQSTFYPLLAFFP